MGEADSENPSRQDSGKIPTADSSNPMTYTIRETGEAIQPLPKLIAKAEQRGEDQIAEKQLIDKINYEIDRRSSVLKHVAGDLETGRRTEEKRKAEDQEEQSGTKVQQKKLGKDKIATAYRGIVHRKKSVENSEVERYTRLSYWIGPDGERIPFTMTYHVDDPDGEWNAVPEEYHQTVAIKKSEGVLTKKIKVPKAFDKNSYDILEEETPISKYESDVSLNTTSQDGALSSLELVWETPEQISYGSNGKLGSVIKETATERFTAIGNFRGTQYGNIALQQQLPFINDFLDPHYWTKNGVQVFTNMEIKYHFGKNGAKLFVSRNLITTNEANEPETRMIQGEYVYDPKERAFMCDAKGFIPKISPTEFQDHLGKVLKLIPASE
jgi:hypothetical protein